MAADWVFGFKLSGADREVVLRRLRQMLAAAPEDSPLTPVIRSFTQQVEAGDDPVRLPVGRLDTIGKIHLSESLGPRGLVTPSGDVTCVTCQGAGTVRLPPVLMQLQNAFDYAYSLSQLGGPERQPYLDQSPDPAERARKAAERQAEAEKRRDALHRSERVRVLSPGTPREDMFAEPAAPVHEFVPTGLKGR